MKMSMPMSQKDYQAHDDACTLAKAQEIRADKSRVKAAAGAAKKMMVEKKREMKGLMSTARMGMKKR